MKKRLIALVLGTLLALNVASVAAAKVSIIGLPNTDVLPDGGSTRTVIDAGSRLSARLRAIDSVFYADSLGADDLWQMPDVNYQVAEYADDCSASYY